VHSGRLNSSGIFLESQALVGDGTLSVTVASSNTLVGTISTSPITIAGGSSAASTLFQPVGAGNTTITASASQFASAQVVATLTSGSLVLPTTLMIGRNLQEEVNVILPQTAGAGGVQVAIQSNSPLLELAASISGAGSSSIVVTVPAGQNYTTFYIHGLASTGTGTYTATATGAGPATGTVQLAPSAVVLFPVFVSRTLAQGSAPLSVFTAMLDELNFPSIVQSPAGGQPVTVTIQNTNPSVGSTLPTITLFPGSSGSTLTVAFLNIGSTTVSVVQPAGFSTPSALGAASVNITP